MPVPAGEVAVIEVALLTTNEVAFVLPNFTAVVPVKLAPVMVTLAPPAVEPLFGEIEVTDGAVAEYVEIAARKPPFAYKGQWQRDMRRGARVRDR